MGRATIPTLDELVVRIERLRPLVDQRLTRPASWRGPLRGEFTRGKDSPEDRARVALAFDRLAADVVGKRPRSADDLASLNVEIAGGDGYRTREVRVGGADRPPETLPPASQVPDLVEAALIRSLDGTEPAPVASSRLHLELLRIHPFHDGNGRTARLASACVLIVDGFRSTLFTAVEQHSHGDRWAYGQAFATLRVGGWVDRDAWLVTALVAAAGRATFAAWWKEREDRDGRFTEDRAYRRWRRHHPRNAEELDEQVGRLREEEAEDLAHPS